MDTVGWVFILIAAFLARGVAKGRGIASFTDVGDAFLAAVEFDPDKLKAVWERTGDGNSSDTTAANATTANAVNGNNVGAGDLLAEMHVLGASAKGYKWSKTGPTYYDCSGMVYAALKALKMYDGPRFTTSTFPAVAGKIGYSKVSGTPQPSDIIHWSGHMGVVSDSTHFYGAQSTKTGIRTDTISALDGERGSHTLYRLGGSGNIVVPGGQEVSGS